MYEKIEPYLNDAVRIDIKKIHDGQKVEIEYADGHKIAGMLNTDSFHPQPVTGLSSIIEHFARGNYGSTSWRGNCSGLLIRDLLLYYEPKFVIDPMVGGGTTEDVCRKLNIPHLCLDLNPKYGGFDAFRDELPRSADFIFIHPPYFVFPGSKMPVYSGKMWGDKPHEDDGSHIHDEAAFTRWFNHVQANLFQALRNGGRAVYLIGDSRFSGKYYSMFKSMDVYGTLENVMIKRQFNCMSDSTAYASRFIPLEHEYVVVIRKDDIRHMRCLLVHEQEIDFTKSQKITWRALLQLKIETLGGKATREQIFNAVSQHPKAKGNKHVREKIRQVINMFPSEFKKDRNIISLAA
jgi:hypothetical protein